MSGHICRRQLSLWWNTQVQRVRWLSFTMISQKGLVSFDSCRNAGNVACSAAIFLSATTETIEYSRAVRSRRMTARLHDKRYQVVSHTVCSPCWSSCISTANLRYMQWIQSTVSTKFWLCAHTFKDLTLSPLCSTEMFCIWISDTIVYSFTSMRYSEKSVVHSVAVGPDLESCIIRFIIEVDAILCAGATTPCSSKASISQNGLQLYNFAVLVGNSRTSHWCPLLGKVGHAGVARLM